MNENLKKIAFVVEGATEAKFIEKLLIEVLNENDYTFEKLQQDGSRKGDFYTIIQTAEIKEVTKFYFLIVNCCSDAKVPSYIKDHRINLLKKGYTTIIGLLDLYPTPKENLFKFQYGVKAFIPQKDLPSKFIISVMEIETWFIAESSHFAKIDEQLTPDFINQNLGVNLNIIKFEDINHPAQLLNAIYQLAGFSYKKKQYQINRTVESLDYANIYFELPNKIESLKELIDTINEII